MTTLALAGFVKAPSGAGVIHERLAEGLPRAVGDRASIVRTDPTRSSLPSVVSRLRATAPDCDALIWTSTPLPLGIQQRTALYPFVHDLRWMRTRSWPARIYRAVDTARTIRRATGFLTNSQTVASQISLFTDKPIGILPLGPGQVEGAQVPPPENSQTIVLIGGAPHKRNEDLARLLVASKLVRSSYQVIAIGVSPTCEEILRAGLREGCVKVTRAIPTEELIATFSSASAFMSLATSEGFGFSYLEASYLGCDVIAPLQPLTTEVLGSDACLLRSASPTVNEVEAALESWDAPRVNRLQARASTRSWSQTASSAANFVLRHV